MASMSISVQRYNPDPSSSAVLTWSEPSTCEVTAEAAAEHRQYLAVLRRTRDLVHLPDGLEFDTYHDGQYPPGCPELAHSRTRVTFSA